MFFFVFVCGFSDKWIIELAKGVSKKIMIIVPNTSKYYVWWSVDYFILFAKKKNRIFLKLVYYWDLEMSILQIIDINKNKILNKRWKGKIPHKYNIKTFVIVFWNNVSWHGYLKIISEFDAFLCFDVVVFFPYCWNINDITYLCHDGM